MLMTRYVDVGGDVIGYWTGQLILENLPMGWELLLLLLLHKR